MAGLPKKYAKMGFKKGWKAYRASKRTKKKSLNTRRASTPSMAKKRRSIRRRASKVAKRRSSKGLGKAALPLANAAYGFTYGVIETPVKYGMTKIPFAKVGDIVVSYPVVADAVMLGFDLTVALLAKGKIRNFAANGVTKESGNMGNRASSYLMGIALGSDPAAQSSNDMLFG
jgi:hypothetical protein